MALPGDYQEPDEVIAGQPVPAESFNKYGNSIIWLKNKIGDSSTFDDIAPTTTKGDLIVHGASGNERLPIGGGAEFLMSTGEMPQWQILDPYLNMSAVSQGELPVAHGGTGANLSATGGAGHVLKQPTAGGAITVAALEASDIPNLDTSKLTSGQLPVAHGGTGANLSATGGAGHVLKQPTAGGAITVAALEASDIPNLDTSKITSGQLASARGGVPSGTAFPSSPAIGDRFFRTDLGLECYWDGSWVTTFECVVPVVTQTQFSANTNTAPVLVSAADIFRVTKITMSALVVTTNNASNYWSIELQAVNDAFSASTTVMSVTTASMTPNTYYRSPQPIVAAQIAVGRSAFRLALTKTGSPGDLRIMLTVHCRFVIT